MKKQVLTTASILLFGLFANAQNNNANPSATGANWKSNGNAAVTSDFIGTTNAQDLIFKTNNTERLLLDKTGNLIVKDPGIGGGGEVIIGPGNLHRPEVTNPVAAFLLKVGGNGYFEGKVDMLQAIVQEMVWAKQSIKTPRIDVDSIKMDSTRGIYGHTRIFGNVDIKQNLTVDGDATFNNTLTAKKGVMFDGTSGIKYVPNNNGGGAFRYGNNNLLPPLATGCAAAPNTTATHQFFGNLQVFDNSNPTTSGLLNLQTWAGGSSIDASVSGNTGIYPLLINYFCGQDVAICTGANGGTVFMGKTVIRTNDENSLDIINPATGKSNFRIKTTGETWARRVVVQLADYPDYVFAKNYSLMPLDALEKYIAANKHLPNVPSAKEIEANGADLGELNKIQMEKIEELTLYIIEMKKELEALKKQVNNSK